MLASNDIVNKAMQLDTKGIVDALNRGGYVTKPSEIKASRFLGMNPGGQFVYEILYKDENLGHDAKGKVYARIMFPGMEITAGY